MRRIRKRIPLLALKRARDGETVVIAREGEPVAEPRPIKREKRDGKAAPRGDTRSFGLSQSALEAGQAFAGRFSPHGE